jgi:hypothetical protein
MGGRRESWTRSKHPVRNDCCSCTLALRPHNPFPPLSASPTFFFLTVSFYHLNLQKNCFFLYGNSLVCEHGVRGSGGSCLAPPFMVMAGGASRGDGDGTPPSFFSLPTDADAATCAERREGDEVWTAARVDFGVWTHPPLGLLFSLLPVPAIINPSLAVRFPPHSSSTTTPPPVEEEEMPHCRLA